MLSHDAVDLMKVLPGERDKEIVRLGMIAELDAVSLYEQLAAATDNKQIKAVMLDIAKEEKTHMGEFQAMLLKLDTEQKEELVKGQKEVDELTQ